MANPQQNNQAAEHTALHGRMVKEPEQDTWRRHVANRRKAAYGQTTEVASVFPGGNQLATVTPINWPLPDDRWCKYGCEGNKYEQPSPAAPLHDPRPYDVKLLLHGDGPYLDRMKYRHHKRGHKEGIAPQYFPKVLVNHRLIRRGSKWTDAIDNQHAEQGQEEIQRPNAENPASIKVLDRDIPQRPFFR